MSARSYLFAANVVPGQRPAAAQSPDLIGIAEHGLSVPLVFRLLVSAGTSACKSLVWAEQGDVALVGDYAEGVRRLKDFLCRISWPEARPLAEEAIGFLDEPRHRRRYFLLECTEIYAMHRESLPTLNRQLLASLPELVRGGTTLLAEQVLASVPAGAPSADRLAVLRVLGLGGWSKAMQFFPRWSQSCGQDATQGEGMPW